jgi:hypothetical protein
MAGEREIEQVGCIKCGKRLDNIGLTTKGYQPNDGLAFNTQGHYGTTYFDPMDGSYLEIVVCDECIEKAEEDGLVFRSRPLPHSKEEGKNE